MKKIMSKLVLVLLCAVTAFTSIKSTAQTYTGGVWIYTKTTTTNFYNDFVNQPVVGEHFIDLWKDVKPTKNGAYQWAKLDSALYQAARRGHWIGVQNQTGNNCPQWVMDEVGTYNTSGGSYNGPYPYYFNPLYKQYLFAYLKDYVVHLALLPDWVKAKMVYRMNAEGYTGDQGPHKGTPTNYNYGGSTDITNAEWNTWRRQFWDSCAKYHAAYFPALKTMYNCGNDGEDFDYVAWKYPGGKNKEGDLTHEYGFSGEITYFNRDKNFALRNGQTYLNKLATVGATFDPAILQSRAEMQGPALSPTKPHKENFFRFVYARTAGLTWYNITQGYVNQAKETFESEASSVPVVWFNKMSGAGEKNRGYSLPRDAPSWDDTARFPVGTYGAVVAAGDLASYNAQIANVNSRPDSLSYKEWLRIKVLDGKINPARQTAILAAVPGAQFGNTEYTRDCGTDMVQNLEMNLTQLNVLTTSKGEWRVGPDTSFYGRFARSPILVSGKQVWQYDVSDAIMKTRSSDTLQIEVVYLDSGTESFKITCEKCQKQTVATVVKINSGNWKKVVVDVPKFRFRPLRHDFNIEFTGSTTIGMIEVWNKSK